MIQIAVSFHLRMFLSSIMLQVTSRRNACHHHIGVVRIIACLSSLQLYCILSNDIVLSGSFVSSVIKEVLSSKIDYWSSLSATYV